MLRPWHLWLAIRRDGGLPAHLQIAQQVAEDIQQGRLHPGDALPGSRELAAQLGLNRKTVVSAYEELAAQGWVSAEGRRGTFVAPSLPAPALQPAATEALAQQSRETWRQREPELIDFSENAPDSRLIPFDVLGRAYRRALIATARSGKLSYGDPAGEPALRGALAQMLNMERGLHAGLDDICLARGSLMGIYLAGKAMLRPGDAAVFDRLSYPSARRAFASHGAECLDADGDEQGMLPQALEALCRSHRVKLVYLTPHHQFPTTRMMPAERRLQILALAERYDFHIVEDDYDHEFHFAHRPMLPMASLAGGHRVIYIGSLSKVLAPGLRIGFIVARPELVARCVDIVLLLDRQGNPVTELAVAELIDSGEFRRHLRRAWRVYQKRRQVLLESLAAELCGLAEYEPPAGGLAIWLRFAERVDMDRLAADARLRGVKILPGSFFAADQAAVAGMRLCFADVDEDKLRLGVRRLGEALRAQL
ncbi:PLP-dependent aminotransferase family protein [Chromobacterium sp. IIBBL 290-4]|uniref:MocR-like pyridoxine biosynthesis transcription factor PdxR n=1 Tax=Chromobacterium sp. IIBBL 290-4 TaxID=2953890 RepID=UPI0020B84B35|nr:PLP-dependent aminotransferase family protein [Chromobacterium sp. IIBBL 290-4]UTH75911.1 PLP-dependent aminotransferase family protein [Chromobacterium sp. IIBBL 290-4]